MHQIKKFIFLLKIIKLKIWWAANLLCKFFYDVKIHKKMFPLIQIAGWLIVILIAAAANSTNNCSVTHRVD